MPSKAERARRRGLKRELARRERAGAEASLPVAAGELRELLMWLDGKLSAEGCDDTNRHTAGFAEARGWPRAQLVEWLAAQGGYCDCEVLANVGEKWLD
jgi:hypothetical protein